MQLLKRSLFFILLLTGSYADASTWYLDKNDVLRNDELPELSIHTKNGVSVFYINHNGQHKTLPVVQQGPLAKMTASAALIDSVKRRDTLCIEFVEDANGQEQGSKNMYIIYHNHVTAFQPHRPDITCKSELYKRQNHKQ